LQPWQPQPAGKCTRNQHRRSPQRADTADTAGREHGGHRAGTADTAAMAPSSDQGCRNPDRETCPDNRRRPARRDAWPLRVPPPPPPEARGPGGKVHATIRNSPGDAGRHDPADRPPHRPSRPPRGGLRPHPATHAPDLAAIPSFSPPFQGAGHLRPSAVQDSTARNDRDRYLIGSLGWFARNRPPTLSRMAAAAGPEAAAGPAVAAAGPEAAGPEAGAAGLEAAAVGPAAARPEAAAAGPGTQKLAGSNTDCSTRVAEMPDTGGRAETPAGPRRADRVDTVAKHATYKLTLKGRRSCDGDTDRLADQSLCDFAQFLFVYGRPLSLITVSRSTPLFCGTSRKHATAHVGATNRQPDPNTRRNRDHRRSKTSSTRRSAEALTPLPIRTR